LPSATKLEFFAYLRDNFGPELRRLGFKGSGQKFRRVHGEVINMINIQGYKYGGSVAVNLGLHLDFLPDSFTSEWPDLSKLREYDCEFRTRLTPRWRFDYWWKYDGLFRNPSRTAAHLVSTYLDRGEPQYAKFDATEKIASSISPKDIVAGRDLKIWGPVASIRAALTFAIINQHLGNDAIAREFAQAGLHDSDRAPVLRAKLEAILGAT
jgi:hypothetical protein